MAVSSAVAPDNRWQRTVIDTVIYIYIECQGTKVGAPPRNRNVKRNSRYRHMTATNPPPTDQSAPVAIRSTRDITAALMTSLERRGLILAEEDLCPGSFELRSGLAREVVQKFVNYRGLPAIIVPDSQAHGGRFSDLICEHQRHPSVRFFFNRIEARKWLDCRAGRT
jgi:hypothetical protein